MLKIKILAFCLINGVLLPQYFLSHIYSIFCMLTLIVLKMSIFDQKWYFRKIFLSSSLEFKRYSLDPSCSTRKGTFAAKWYLRFEFESASFATSDEISNRFSVGKFSFRCSKSVIFDKKFSYSCQFNRFLSILTCLIENGDFEHFPDRDNSYLGCENECKLSLTLLIIISNLTRS